MKKIFLLVIFVIPIITYLFFSSATHHFGKLDVLTKNIPDLNAYNTQEKKPPLFKNKVSIIGFLGDSIQNHIPSILNLNEKIYKKFHPYDEFQCISILPNGTQHEISLIKNKLELHDNKLSKWHFLYLDKQTIKSIFMSLNTPDSLDDLGYTKKVYIIDKNKQLRGNKAYYGVNAESISDVNKILVDDLKMMMAEYRMALKKNDSKIKLVD